MNVLAAACAIAAVAHALAKHLFVESMEPHGADRYAAAQVPVVTHEGEEALYAIIFTLDKVKGLGGPHLEWFAFV